jgi:hypothetical protein
VRFCSRAHIRSVTSNPSNSPIVILFRSYNLIIRIREAFPAIEKRCYVMDMLVLVATDTLLRIRRVQDTRSLTQGGRDVVGRIACSLKYLVTRRD